ncbi:MAG: histidine triad nucleotide-binding protein [Methylomonas sp.]|nr:histidine triad nucleotide-binding protein [Methylomonas sp.]PPD22219.1 MAG: histidine triad nucleotide-binding protein [Methylomonas sp.]PPD27756.1 MAG: histidine triad nucleotide-binding protein [Methylomonas sp.]PPD39766.1 MAG: histidine triad nucleotide-binding protein [Methylomonas sp.]PPD42540.1 MAG: histidine triad nucleotide-binding protein [Methylomonas sp.]
MSDCLFCKIVAGSIKANVVYDDDEVLAFHDLNPQAPLHVLVIPKRHVENLNALDDAELGGHLLRVAAQIAHQHGYAERGYRTVINCNADGGQTVFHLHVHLLAGRALHWPPG